MGFIESLRASNRMKEFIEFIHKHTKFVLKGKFILILMFFAGIINISLGIGLLTEDNDTHLDHLDKMLKEDDPSDLRWKIPLVGSLMIGVGLLLIIIGFLGSYAALKESRFRLNLFFGMLLVLFIAQVAGAALVLSRSKKCDFARSRHNITTVYGSSGAEAQKITDEWTEIMESTAIIYCCGFCSYVEFNNSAYYDGQMKYKEGLKAYEKAIREKIKSVDGDKLDHIHEALFGLNESVTVSDVDVDEYPPQCCRSMETECTEERAKRSYDAEVGIKRDGCYNEFKRAIEDDFDFAARWALGVAVLELCAMVVSMILIRKIGSGETKET